MGLSCAWKSWEDFDTKLGSEVRLRGLESAVGTKWPELCVAQQENIASLQNIRGQQAVATAFG